MDGLTGCRTDEHIDRHTDDQTNYMMVGQMEVGGMYKRRNEQTNWTDELMTGRTDIHSHFKGSLFASKKEKHLTSANKDFIKKEPNIEM